MKGETDDIELIMHTCYGLMEQGVPEANLSNEEITDFRAPAKLIEWQRSKPPENETPIRQ